MDTQPVSSGAQPPLVEYFAIEGLYGYRSVAMTAKNAATILIARNGSGKTTLLGALDSFLRGQFGRLAALHFDRVVCRLRGTDELLELSAQDIESLMSVPEIPEFISMARRLGVEPARLLDFLENDFSASKSYNELEDDEVFKQVMSSLSYSFRDAKRTCEKLIDVIRGRVPAVDKIRTAIQRVIKGVEILYLPTYRRIELSLGESVEDSRLSRKRKSIQSRLGLPKRGFFNAEIQFGLSDISERLQELNNRLLFRSNQGYREISAKIINDLLDGTFEREAPALGDRPDKESLALFFSRLKQGPAFPAHFDRVEIPDIDKIYNEGATSLNSDKFLNYFLSKLNSVIQATRSIEGLVEEFVQHCNDYLSAREATTEILGDSATRGVAGDEKRLEIDRMTLQVSVRSVGANRKVPMDSLSSGEKQMISLFAKLYLYDGQKIVLIDEPELSLSIDWQRKILIDVMRAPTCAQMVAITHSPFVFDNDLERFARALDLRVAPALDPGGSEADLFLGTTQDE